MALRQMLLEMGMGVDLHGQDDTKAARRAVENAIRCNSINFIRHMVKDPNEIQVHVTLGVPHPEKVDKQKVLDVLPFGKGSLEAVLGGLEIPCGKDALGESTDDSTIIANAAITVSVDLPSS